MGEDLDRAQQHREVLVEIAVEDPASSAARFCLAFLAPPSSIPALTPRSSTRRDASLPAATGDLAEPAGVLLLARISGEPAGCGALKFHGTGPAELKRMWVAPSARGLGVGRRILAELEQYARQRGTTVLRLETSRHLTEAISLYRSAGYAEVPAFSDEPYAHHWFEKHLTKAPRVNARGQRDEQQDGEHRD